MNKKDLKKAVEKEEVDVMLHVSPDSKIITITMKSEDPFTVQSFLVELETYLHEVGLAADQKSMAGAPN